MVETVLLYGHRPLRLVSFDIDGTIAVGHGWRAIARSRGMLKDFDLAQVAFREGGVSENDHLRRLLNFAQDMPLRDLEKVLERTRHVPHLRATVRALHERGVQVALLTHNPLYVCEWYARRFGFDLWAGVHQRVHRGRIQGVREVKVDKREGLRLLLKATGVPASETAHLGDGLADAKVFPHVASGIALNSRVPEVRRASDLIADTMDARALLPYLRWGLKLRPRPLPRGNPGPDPGSFRLGRARTPQRRPHKF